MELHITVDYYWDVANLDIRPQNFLLTFESKDITVQELIDVEKQNKQCLDPEDYKIKDDNNGKIAIYGTNAIALVPEGEAMDLKKLIVKISDFGKGESSHFNDKTDLQQA